VNTVRASENSTRTDDRVKKTFPMDNGRGESSYQPKEREEGRNEKE